jgi:hypothetical protein
MEQQGSANFTIHLFLCCVCFIIYLPYGGMITSVYIIEPIALALLASGVLYLLFSAQIKPFSRSQWFLLLFILYTTTKDFLFGHIDFFQTVVMFLGLMFYTIGIDVVRGRTFQQKYKCYYFVFISVLIWYVLITLIFASFRDISVKSLYLPNNSIFSILLASQLVFIFPIYLGYRKNNSIGLTSDWIFAAIICCVLVLLFFTKGRAGWLGLLVGICVLISQIASKNQLRRLLLRCLLVACCLLLPLMFFFKFQSTQGRILVYKVSLPMLQQNWALGVGNRQFRVEYNKYQAEYFAKHNINGKEGLLADNTYFAFNDYLEFAVEVGIFGVLLLGIAIYYLCRDVKLVKTENANKFLIIGAKASLACILCAALFSYPFRNVPICIQAILCLSILGSMSERSPSSRIKEWGTKIFMAFLVTTIFAYSFHLAKFRNKTRKAFQLSTEGYRNKALEIYNSSSTSFLNDGQVHFEYAYTLYLTNRLLEAQKQSELCKKYYSRNDVYLLSSKINTELGNLEVAEDDLKTAVFMVPNRIVSRKALLDFYVETKDTSKVIIWGESIIRMPIKVPSRITEVIQEETKAIVQRFTK